MRKLILISTMVMLATQAHAGGSRSLSLAASPANQQATEQPAATAPFPPKATQAPAVGPPTNVQTATTAPASTPPAATAPTATTTVTAPATTPAQSAAAPVASTIETTKPKRRQPSTEARVIRELHRHGIYW